MLLIFSRSLALLGLWIGAGYCEHIAVIIAVPMSPDLKAVHSVRQRYLEDTPKWIRATGYRRKGRGGSGNEKARDESG